VNSYYISSDESIRTYLGLPNNAEVSKLYRNLGDGTFRDVSAETRLDKVLMPMAANFGDVNNDGYLDMYLGMGSPSFAAVLPHELLLNKDGKSFVSATASSGTGELHKGHGIAFADLDRDGDEDIVAEIGGAVPADRHALRLFENPGGDNDWINLRLVGVTSNRSAIGARITVTVESGGDNVVTTRSIHRFVRRESHGAAHRSRQTRENPEPRHLVADEPHTPDVCERRKEPVHRDPRVGEGVHEAREKSGSTRWKR
jgi:hypothetical protein